MLIKIGNSWVNPTTVDCVQMHMQSSYTAEVTTNGKTIRVELPDEMTTDQIAEMINDACQAHCDQQYMRYSSTMVDTLVDAHQGTFEKPSQ